MDAHSLVSDWRDYYDTPHIWDAVKGGDRGVPAVYISQELQDLSCQWRFALAGDAVRSWSKTIASWALVPRRFSDERLREMLSRRQIFSWQFAAAMRLQSELRPSHALEAIGPYGAREVGLIVLCGLSATDISDPRVARAKGIAEVTRKLRVGLDRLADHYDIQVAPVTEQQIEAETVHRKANALIRMQIDTCREAERAYDRCDPDENDFFRGWSNKKDTKHYRVVTRGPLLKHSKNRFQLVAGRSLLWIQNEKGLNLWFLLANGKPKKGSVVEFGIDVETTHALLAS